LIKVLFELKLRSPPPPFQLKCWLTDFPSSQWPRSHETSQQDFFEFSIATLFGLLDSPFPVYLSQRPLPFTDTTPPFPGNPTRTFDPLCPSVVQGSRSFSPLFGPSRFFPLISFSDFRRPQLSKTVLCLVTSTVPLQHNPFFRASFFFVPFFFSPSVL